MKKFLSGILLSLVFSCNGQEPQPSSPGPVTDSDYESIGIVGDKRDVKVPTEFGVALVGGSTDVDEALQWMISKAPGGDVVIIRASGSTGYNEYIYGLGNVNSVETLMINSRSKAMSQKVAERIKEAEMLFIAGGDQANYVNFWKDTPVSDAIQYLIDVKRIPIGGTSAGCAVLSDIIFDALHDTVISGEALNNPYDEKVSLSKSFMRVPFLENTISDQHYAHREREGRHVVFMARLMKDFGVHQPKGIGVDEKTAVCVDHEGNALVYGTNKAYFIIGNTPPETCVPNTPLTWDQGDKALSVYIFQGTSTGTPAFNLKLWPTGTSSETWFIEQALLKRVVNR
ncbi:MAG: cyanophycinase [Cyclobacteriaceae bacterium]